MNAPIYRNTRVRTKKAHVAAAHTLPGQVVVVLQGGGALGAYQVGVYQAMHEAGIEPDWVIGTSIGAINAALIAGNKPQDRLQRLHAFWDHVEHHGYAVDPFAWLGLSSFNPSFAAVSCGIPSFFRPSLAALQGSHARLGIDAAAYYNTDPLRRTLGELVDFDGLRDGATRLTVGAVNANSGEMRYFDSRTQCIAVDHVMASGAMPPAFPAIRINGEPYWDGGIYSNTPIEAVLDDVPRRDSVIFAVNVWHQQGPEPQSIWEVMGRQKEIQFASRADSHIAKQKQIHRLRHVIRELSAQIPAGKRRAAHVKELASWGCHTTMHVAYLVAPRLDGEDYTKDIDFTSSGIHERWTAGYADTLKMIEASPWNEPIDPIEGVIVHRLETIKR